MVKVCHTSDLTNRGSPACCSCPSWLAATHWLLATHIIIWQWQKFHQKLFKHEWTAARLSVYGRITGVGLQSTHDVLSKH